MTRSALEEFFGAPTFEGTPTEVGAQIWERMCLPAVGTASKGLSPLELGQLYGGFVMAAFGAMTADFGHDQAMRFAQQMLDAFAKFDLEGSATQ